MSSKKLIKEKEVAPRGGLLDRLDALDKRISGLIHNMPLGPFELLIMPFALIFNRPPGILLCCFYLTTWAIYEEHRTVTRQM